MPHKKISEIAGESDDCDCNKRNLESTAQMNSRREMIR